MLMDKLQIMQRQLKPAYNLCSLLSNWFLLSIPSIAFFGCQISWSLQNGFSTPQLQFLGLQDKYVNYVWLAGPLTGIIIQPLIGVWSDSMENTKNRRRPFIIAGTILLIISLLLFSNSVFFTSSYYNYGLLIGIIAFCFQDISVNMVQAPLRALISDIIPSQHHSTSNSLFGLFNGIGCAIGYGLGALLSYNQNLGGGISILYAFGAVIILFASLTTLYWSKNEQLLDIDDDVSIWSENNDELSPTPVQHDELLPLLMSATSNTPNHGLSIHSNAYEAVNNRNQNGKSKLRIILEAIYFMPTPIFRAFVVQFLVHYTHCCLAMYLTDFFGKHILNGNPQGDAHSVKRYEKGVKYATIGLFLMSIVSIPISMLLPKLCQRFGSQLVWFTSCLTYCSVMISLALLPTIDGINMKEEFGIILIGFCSFPLSTSKVIGWTIVTRTLCSDKKNNDKRALYTTIFNLANASPGIFVSIVSGSILMACNHDVSAILVMGSVAAFIGAISCCFLIDLDHTEL